MHGTFCWFYFYGIVVREDTETVLFLQKCENMQIIKATQPKSRVVTYAVRRCWFISHIDKTDIRIVSRISIITVVVIGCGTVSVVVAGLTVC